MNGKLRLRRDDCLLQWLLRKVYLCVGVRGTGILLRVLLEEGYVYFLVLPLISSCI